MYPFQRERRVSVCEEAPGFRLGPGTPFNKHYLAIKFERRLDFEISRVFRSDETQC